MTLARITLGILLAALALAASACGGGSDSVPSGAIAVVDGTEISEDDLDELIAQAKKGYEAQKQEFPKAGTPEFQSIQTQYVAYLVELEEFRQAAEELGVSVTDEDVDKAEQELIKSRFDGKRTAYEKALEAQGFTAEQYREKALAVSALSKKIFDEVTKGGGSRAEREVAIVLRGMERGARHEGDLILSGETSYLDLVGRVFRQRPKAAEPAKPLIVLP